jgi:hypothetical protein
MSLKETYHSRSAPPVGKRIPMDRGEPYTCPELKRSPGIADARFEAFRLPSRMGDRLVYPRRQP